MDDLVERLKKLHGILHVAAGHPADDEGDADALRRVLRDRAALLEAATALSSLPPGGEWREAVALREAVETFVYDYRQRYAKPTTSGIRSGAPMRAEVAALNAALAKADQIAALGGDQGASVAESTDAPCSASSAAAEATPCKSDVKHADDCQSHIVDVRGRPDDCTCGAANEGQGDLEALDPSRWEVTVRVDGTSVLTIGSHGYLAGYEGIDRFGDAVRAAAEHLRSFIGTGEPPPCFACGGDDEHCPVCAGDLEGGAS